MSYLPLSEREGASAEVQAEFDYWNERSGRITNMKRTLLHDLPTYRAYMEWYPLYDSLAQVVGKRALNIFCYAISTNNHCLLCSTFFQQIFIDAGEDPADKGAFQLTGTEQLLLDFGAAIATDPNRVPEGVYASLKETFTDEQIVQLIGFAAQMVATNYFNMVAQVPLDETLESYATPEFLAQVAAEGR
jgi:alkylhydroperoxidase family enzyme